VLVFVFLSVLLMIADQRFGYMDKVREAFGLVASPFHWLADVPTRVGNSLGEMLLSRSDLIEENARLRGELLLSRQRLMVAEGLAVENHRLLELRDAAALLDQSVLPAEIINVSPDPHSRRVLLNRGSRHSVFACQAVLEANGLMGQVVQVMPFTSWVLLITDPAHVTPIEVSRNGERALARGSQNGDAELDLEFVLPSQDIEVGDILISSGMGLVYPKNYPVAEVVSVNRSSQRPYATIRATPLARISSTRHVVLVLENAAAGIDGEAAGLASIEAAN